MTVYYINLLIILALAFPLCLYKPNRPKKIAYLVVTFGYMWFLATFRLNIGFDYQAYIDIFNQTRESAGMMELLTSGHEPGFLLLSKAMTLFIPATNTAAMYGVYELLMLAPVAWFIYRHCKDVWLSTWLYVTLTFFYGTMNFVRQNLACGIILLGYGFLKNKKPIPFMIIALVAASMHKTALIIIPVYFLCHIPLRKVTGIFYASVAVFFYLTSTLILDFVTRFVYTYYRGTPYLTVGFPLGFLIIPAVVFGGCLALWPVWREREPDGEMLLNLMLFNLIIWLFITRHFILERFSLFVYIFVLVALPSALSCLKAPQEDYDALARYQEAEKTAKKKSASKEEHAKMTKLRQKISDHQKYYWSAVVATLLITAIYNEFGSHVNGFHGVFPYQSVLAWLNP